MMPLEIDVQTVAQLRTQDEEFLLLDCREHDEFAFARIEGAKHLPMQETPQRIDELEPHREGRIIVYCHHGMRSQQVTMWLRQQGFDGAQNMTGGIDAWSLQIDTEVPRY